MAPIDSSSAMHLVPQPDNDLHAIALAEPDPKPALKPTLHNLLQMLLQVDEGMTEFSLDDQLDLLEAGKVKVDNYKYLIDHLESQAVLLKKWEDEYKTARQAVENNVKRLKNHMLFAMQANGFSMFTGNQYVVKLLKAAPAVEVKGEPTAAMKIKYDGFIKTSYEWDKKAIGAALKAGDPKAAELGSLRETVYPKFSIVKGV